PPLRRSSPLTATPSNHGSRAVSLSASIFRKPQRYPQTPSSKAQTSPTSTASPPPCFSSLSINTKSPSSSRNAPPRVLSPHSRALAQALPSAPQPPQTCTSLLSATSTQPT